MDRRDQARPSLVGGEVRASWDERRRQTKTRPRRRQHLPAGDTRPLRRCMATCSRNDSPSHNSWSALGGRWIASDHLGLTSPHVLSGSGFCCISAAPGATPPRPTLSALRPPLPAVARHSGPSAQVSDRGPETRSGLFHAGCQQQPTLYQESGTACLVGTNSRNPMRDTLPQVVIPVIPTRASRGTAVLQTYMTSRTLEEVMLCLHGLASMPSLTMIKPPWSVSPSPEAKCNGRRAECSIAICKVRESSWESGRHTGGSLPSPSPPEGLELAVLGPKQNSPVVRRHAQPEALLKPAFQSVTRPVSRPRPGAHPVCRPLRRRRRAQPPSTARSNLSEST